jgi:plastocyanin
MKKYQTAWIGLSSVLAMAANIGVSMAATTTPTTNLVQVRGQIGQAFTFNPSNIVISPGDSITWTNISNTSHDVTHATRMGSTWVSNTPPYWAGILLSNPVFRSTVTFSNLGVYPYICVRHVITVPQPNAANPTQTGLVTVAIQNLKPTVAITSPTDLSRFDAPASFSITADAADPDLDGGVTNVQFFAGTNLLGADPVAPYSFDASNLAGGWYQLTARATDNLGGSSTSAVVNILVNSNRTVQVVGTSFSPNLLSVTVGDTVAFNGLASFHTVTGSGTVEPFCGSASPGASCMVTFNAVGAFPFHCVPHRAFGMTGSVQVVGPNLRPTARITSPSDGSVFATGATFTVTADASDLYGRVASVRFFRPVNVSLGLDVEAPYSATVSSLPAGNYVISALVTDNTSLTSTSEPINISVVAPVSIQLLSPAAGVGGFQFDFTANPGFTYVIEGSEADGSPTPFVPLATNLANTNPMTFIDTTSGARSNRAYRVFRRP